MSTAGCLLAAVLAVPVATRLGLGSLLAGIATGLVLGLVRSGAEGLRHLAEFGAVMLPILIGFTLEARALRGCAARSSASAPRRPRAPRSLSDGTMLFELPRPTAGGAGALPLPSSTAMMLPKPLSGRA